MLYCFQIDINDNEPKHQSKKGNAIKMKENQKAITKKAMENLWSQCRF
jgi:hypothetical protein